MSLNLDELVAEQTSYVAQGIKAVKMKVAKNAGTAIREDLLRLAAVREAVGDDVAVYVDANWGYSVKQAMRISREFERYGVGWLEEPIMADDIDGLARVARATTIPIATGEHEYTKYGFRDLISRGGADIVQPNAARVGGITEWLKIAHLAHAYNLPVAPHNSQLVHLHLACATPNLHSIEYLSSHAAADQLIYGEVPLPKDGRLSPFPDKPGLGLELNPSAVERYAVH